MNIDLSINSSTLSQHALRYIWSSGILQASQSSDWICVDKGCVHVFSPIAYCILKLPSIAVAVLFSRFEKWSEVLVVARVTPRDLRRPASTIIARHATKRSFQSSLLDSLPSATAIRAGSAARKICSQPQAFADRAAKLALAAVVKK